jgi:pimeloyl-ACP methyl ester carboxylesterase
MIGALSFKPEELSLGVVGRFSEEALRQIKMPVLMLVGEYEKTYALEPSQVLERARQWIPHIEAELIPGGKHLFPVDQADVTNARILKFLNGG